MFILTAVVAVACSCVVPVVLHQTVDPTFTVVSKQDVNGSCLLEIEPSFNVNSIYSVKVSDGANVIASNNKSTSGRQTIWIPPGISSGTRLTVDCDLQFDRGISACIMMVSKTVSMPEPLPPPESP